MKNGSKQKVIAFIQGGGYNGSAIFSAHRNLYKDSGGSHHFFCVSFYSYNCHSDKWSCIMENGFV